jgi:hypothetical protein
MIFFIDFNSKKKWILHKLCKHLYRYFLYNINFKNLLAMTKDKDKLKKKQQLEIAERKVHKAVVRAAKAQKKLEKVKSKTDDKTLVKPLKADVSDKHKRLHRNLKQLKKIEEKV